MTLSLRAKILMAIAALVGLVAFLIVVDLGINAGRIHYGVSVSGADVGGLTRSEALEKLTARAEEIGETPISLLAQGLNVAVPPSCLSWQPFVRGTVQRAYRIGR